MVTVVGLSFVNPFILKNVFTLLYCIFLRVIIVELTKRNRFMKERTSEYVRAGTGDVLSEPE